MILGLPLNTVKIVLGTSLRHALQYNNNNWSRSADAATYVRNEIFIAVFLSTKILYFLKWKKKTSYAHCLHT